MLGSELDKVLASLKSELLGSSPVVKVAKYSAKLSVVCGEGGACSGSENVILGGGSEVPSVRGGEVEEDGAGEDGSGATISVGAGCEIEAGGVAGRADRVLSAMVSVTGCSRVVRCGEVVREARLLGWCSELEEWPVEVDGCGEGP